MEKFEFYKGRVIDANTKVFVYFNLRKKVFSVKALSGEHKGKVVLHADSISIIEAQFIVSQSGRNRVLREKQKNIHAGVAGYLNFERREKPTNCNEKVTYNPYKFTTFVKTIDHSPVICSPIAYLNQKNVWIPQKAAS